MTLFQRLATHMVIHWDTTHDFCTMELRVDIYSSNVILVILGVACISYAVDAKNDMWPSGVTFLAENGHATGIVDAEGRGYLFQLISSVVLVVPYAIYTILLLPARRLQKQNNMAKKIGV